MSQEIPTPPSSQQPPETSSPSQEVPVLTDVPPTYLPKRRFAPGATSGLIGHVQNRKRHTSRGGA